MNELEFRAFLKGSKRKDSAIEQIVDLMGEFEAFLVNFYPGKNSDQTNPEMLESYVSWFESEMGAPATKPLWGVRYYFDFIENRELSDLAGALRAERVKKKPFLIKNFRGVNPDHVAGLDALYIENTDQLLDAARTPKLRLELVQKTGIPLAGLLELVKLGDLARLKGVRSVRARLYHDAGLTPEIIASWEPAELHALLVQWVAENQFDGIPPTPKEVEHLVHDARKLPLIVNW